MPHVTDDTTTAQLVPAVSGEGECTTIRDVTWLTTGAAVLQIDTVASRAAENWVPAAAVMVIS